MACGLTLQIREHNCLLVGTFEATGSIPGLGGDGEVRHVADGGEGLTPESVRSDACEVPKLPQLACGKPIGKIVDRSRGDTSVYTFF